MSEILKFGNFYDFSCVLAYGLIGGIGVGIQMSYGETSWAHP